MTANDNRARARAEDDKQNLDDVRDVRVSLEIALEALRKAMEGQGGENRDQFTFQIGFAVGRLGRVQARIYPMREDPNAA
jgi:hypothetical protein